MRRKSENTQIPFEAFSLPIAHDQTFLTKFQCLLTLGEIEVTEDIHAILPVLVQIKNFKGAHFS